MLDLPLVDGHCHPIVAEPVDAEAFAMLCTEASVPAPAGVSYLDAQLGFAVRRWCAPVLDLPAHAPLSRYLRRRSALGPAEVNRRLMGRAGLSHLLVDTGLRGRSFMDLGGLGSAAGATAREVVRLEHVAQTIAPSQSADGFADAFRSALSDAAAAAVAVKSVVAYRHGLDIEPSRPSAAEVRAAAAGWLRESDAGLDRLTDPVLLRYLLWCGVDTGLPVQLHTGFGDRDLALGRSDPALLQRFCAAVEPSGVPLVLLHCYPYHRQAGWLAQVFPHVYLDIGLTVTYLGARFTDVLGEFLELAPFGKVLYSSDAYGLAELFLVGAAQFRHALSRLLDRWLADDAVSATDGERIASMLGRDNALRVYGLQPRDLISAGRCP